MQIGFLEFSFWDLLDILVIALLIYQVYKLLRGSLAFNIFIGFLIIYVLYYVVRGLQMNVLSFILSEFIQMGFLAIFIIFQPEIRRFLLFIGKRSRFGDLSFWKKIFLFSQPQSSGQITPHISAITKAVNNLSIGNIGALLVFTKIQEEYYFGNTGVILNAEISAKLIESIFQKNSPLHDGAVVISENKIYVAGSVLPISENPDLPKRIGMRHKAAVGITEVIDAYVIVVSEETGHVSIAHKGRLRLKINNTYLKDILIKALGTEKK